MLVVITPILPESFLSLDSNGSNSANTSSTTTSSSTPDKHNDTNQSALLSDECRLADAMDEFNHPRLRRALILKHLSFTQHNRQQSHDRTPYKHKLISFRLPHDITTTATTSTATTTEILLQNDPILKSVHSLGLLQFFQSAWSQWKALGKEGQDPMCILPLVTSTSSTLSSSSTSPSSPSSTTPTLPSTSSSSSSSSSSSFSILPPLIPGNMPLPRDPHHQEPSRNVMGQMGYYCTDNCTPVFSALRNELLCDTAIIQTAVNTVTLGTTTTTTTTTKESDEHETENEDKKHTSNQVPTLAYAMPTHPGHHAAKDSFGGYCYINQAAHAVRLFQDKLNTTNSSSSSINNNNNINNKPHVAVLDIDYHCGNGTVSLFYDDPSVLVVSIHCDPNYDYPFHSGFAHQTGVADGDGTTLHIPLPPGTTWDSHYKNALEEKAIPAIQKHEPQALVISLGLDTYHQDPCAIRRAGFSLFTEDYQKMGTLLGKQFSTLSTSTTLSLPTLIIQEGGYRMDKVPEAASNFLLSYHDAYYHHQRSP